MNSWRSNDLGITNKWILTSIFLAFLWPFKMEDPSKSTSSSSTLFLLGYLHCNINTECVLNASHTNRHENETHWMVPIRVECQEVGNKCNVQLDLQSIDKEIQKKRAIYKVLFCFCFFDIFLMYYN